MSLGACIIIPSKETYKSRRFYSTSASPVLQVSLSIASMSKIFTLITLFTLFPFLSTVFAQTIPSYPDVWDPAYPMNRCVDFCAFLRPGQICPAERYNPNCLCSVYNIRMPAVPSSRSLFLTFSANNAGDRKMLLLRTNCNWS